VVEPFVTAGRLKAVAVTGKERLKIMPEVPTMADLGFPGAESSAWSAVFMAAKTPPAIVKRLGDAIAQALLDPRMQQIANQSGATTQIGLRDEKLGEFVKAEAVRWRHIVEQTGAKLD
jgi:tripartite-type tricarboxylate transporter receptor subunit TctC